MQQSFKNMAARRVTAESEFIARLAERAGISTTDAVKVLAIYRKHKIVKNEYAVSRISVKHGAFWNRDVILRALNSERI